MRGGEVFIPKIPSMKIVDLADVVAPQARRRIIGIRPGEKTNESLITKEEAMRAREFNDYFVIEPEFSFWKPDSLQGGKPLPDAFSYTSDNNDRWLTKDELTGMIKEL